jgi:ketosteroid isomerase-like protein
MAQQKAPHWLRPSCDRVPGWALRPASTSPQHDPASPAQPCTAFPAEPKEDPAMQAIDTFLTEWATAEQDGDTGTLEKLLTGDFTAVGPLGFILPKQGWLARHRQGDLVYQAFTLEEIQARQFGEAAVVTARNNTRGTYQGRPIPEAVRATFTLVSKAGRWQLAAIHMSFIAGTRGAPPIPAASNHPGSKRSVA